jgi:hypothetical protein
VIEGEVSTTDKSKRVCIQLGGVIIGGKNFLQRKTNSKENVEIIKEYICFFNE